MEELLEFYLKYFSFLYLDPNYHITDSSTDGSATINASLTATGPLLSWQLTNNLGQIRIDIAPTKLSSPGNWFRISIIRQYLDGYDEQSPVSPGDAVAWVRDNLSRIEELFSDSSATASCTALTELENANAIKYWGTPKE
ncbi:hypothetical protein [Mycobacterium sp.]|uniref:hypothetical protein n=1 Tax=Mycobacterium sp. TaxID=1785 RepID=UPI003C758523